MISRPNVAPRFDVGVPPPLGVPARLGAACPRVLRCDGDAACASGPRITIYRDLDTGTIDQT